MTDKEFMTYIKHLPRFYKAMWMGPNSGNEIYYLVKYENSIFIFSVVSHNLDYILNTHYNHVIVSFYQTHHEFLKSGTSESPEKNTYHFKLIGVTEKEENEKIYKRINFIDVNPDNDTNKLPFREWVVKNFDEIKRKSVV